MYLRLDFANILDSVGENLIERNVILFHAIAKDKENNLK